MDVKVCKQCEKVFTRDTHQCFSFWERRKFCGRPCYLIFCTKYPGGGYNHRHARIRNYFGQPQKCEECGDSHPRKYEWANISGKYLITRSDWKRLCTSCHRKLDKVYLRPRLSKRNKSGFRG